jgi:hypothetical protein
MRRTACSSAYGMITTVFSKIGRFMEEMQPNLRIFKSWSCSRQFIRDFLELLM